MIVYRAQTKQPDGSGLGRVANHLVKDLFPTPETVRSELVAGTHRSIIKNAKTLAGIELFAATLEEDAYEGILRFAADLESERKRLGSEGRLDEIAIYIFAGGYTPNFVARVQKGFHAHLFIWQSIHAGSEEALLIKDIYRPKVAAASEPPQHREHRVRSKEEPLSDLSTPELVALTRFGMQLREKRAEMVKYA